MKTIVSRFLLLSALAALSDLSASAQVLEHARALGDTRFPVGDPAVTITNMFGGAEDGPKDVAIADLDNDGHLDFAASDKDGSVTVYFGKGDGKFSVPLHLRTWVGSPRDAAGYSVTNYTTNTCVSVWTNIWGNGNPTNWGWTCIPGPATVTTNITLITDGATGLRGLALADFTGDGLADIAVASPGESVIYLLVNQGNRNFAAASILPGWYGVRDLAAGDFDGDGRIDLAAAGTTGGVAQYRSLGNGNFEVVTNLTWLGAAIDSDFPQPAFYLKAFRPPGTTRDELAIGRAQGAPVVILAADASGRLAVQATLANVVVHALDVGALLHPAADGVLDLVTVNHSDDLLEIHPASGGADRFYTNVAASVRVPGRAHGVAIADLDNDGWNDLVVVLQRFDKVQVFRNNHGSFELASELAVGAGPRELAVGDFTGDGRTDAAVLNRLSSDVSVLLAHPTQFGFSTLDMIYPADGEVISLQVFDFNGDGRADVVQIHRAAGEMSVRLARSDGSLADPVFYGLGSKPSDMRTVDLNNDHILDIIAVDLSGFITARLGRGDGTFGPEIRTSLSNGADGRSSSLFSLTTGDFDGDGILDLAAGYMDCRLGLFRGRGDGTFEYKHTHPLGYETHGLATGDFDGDGDIDLVAVPWDGRLIVVENLGDLLETTNLTKHFVTGEAGSGAWNILVTDYNHDGDPDLIIDGRSLYIGGPGLEFTLATNTFSQATVQITISPVTADFNGDGIEDVISACVDRNCISVQLGKAGGGFEPPFLIPVPASKLIATGDIDGDGLPDLVGTGDVLWTALSSRAPALGAPPPPAVQRLLPGKPLLNEVLAANSSIPIVQDGGRNSDFVEIYNGGDNPMALLGWSLRLERTNSVGPATTNIYAFPTNAIIDKGDHLVIVCSDKIRSPFHTGFTLPAEGASVCLLRNDGSEADRVNYPAQASDKAYARFQDGVNGFVVTDTPTPGLPNVDTGLVPPTLSIDGVDLATLQPDQPIRFYARGKDDLGIVNLSLLWRRLDVADDTTKRVILFDDCMHEDGASQDGLFSGVMFPGLPEGAEIQFYLECTDLSGQVKTAPGSPRFVSGDQTPEIYTLAIGTARPALEISEVVAWNASGLLDETGKRPDWFEIRNCSTQNVSLAGVSLGQGYFGNSSRIAFSNTVVLVPGQHLVVFADSKPEAGPLHAPFKLNRAGDQLLLTGLTSRGSRFLIDTVQFGAQKQDLALARLGCGGPWLPNTPTPGTGNVAGSWRGALLDGNFLFGFPTEPGHTYSVESKNRLDGGSWATRPAVSGSGLEQVVTEPAQGNRFYRVRKQ